MYCTACCHAASAEALLCALAASEVDTKTTSNVTTSFTNFITESTRHVRRDVLSLLAAEHLKADLNCVLRSILDVDVAPGVAVLERLRANTYGEGRLRAGCRSRSSRHRIGLRGSGRTAVAEHP